MQQPYGVLFLVAGVLGISHNPFSEKSLDGVSDIKVSKLSLLSLDEELKAMGYWCCMSGAHIVVC